MVALQHDLRFLAPLSLSVVLLGTERGADVAAGRIELGAGRYAAAWIPQPQVADIDIEIDVRVDVHDERADPELFGSVAERSVRIDDVVAVRDGRVVRVA